MEVTTIRLPEEEKAEIATEAEEADLKMAEYIRKILENRHTGLDDMEEVGVDGYHAIEERVSALEERLDEIDTVASAPVDDGPEPAEPPEIDFESLDIPGSGGKLAARRAAIEAMGDYIYGVNRAEKHELLAQIDAEAMGYGSEESFWKNVIQRHKVFQDIPWIRTPGEGASFYEYDPESADE